MWTWTDKPRSSRCVPAGKRSSRTGSWSSSQGCYWRAGLPTSPPHLRYPPLISSGYTGPRTHSTISGLWHMLSSLSGEVSPSLHPGLDYSLDETSLPQGFLPWLHRLSASPSSIPILNCVLLKCPEYFSFVVLIVVKSNYIHDSPT